MKAMTVTEYYVEFLWKTLKPYCYSMAIGYGYPLEIYRDKVLGDMLVSKAGDYKLVLKLSLGFGGFPLFEHFYFANLMKKTMLQEELLDIMIESLKDNAEETKNKYTAKEYKKNYNTYLTDLIYLNELDIRHF